MAQGEELTAVPCVEPADAGAEGDAVALTRGASARSAAATTDRAAGTTDERHSSRETLTVSVTRSPSSVRSSTSASKISRAGRSVNEPTARGSKASFTGT